MAQILPFRAWRYHSGRVRLEDVLTQPYDKITPAMQSDYYAKSPYNLVRMELGRTEDADTEQNNIYTRAMEFLEQCKREGAIVQDPEPAIYAYIQTFAVPDNAGMVMTRRGFIALGRLHDYSDGIIHRHEQTLSKPKTDRLNLLRATRAHTGQIFMLYSDPERKVDALICQAAGRAPQDAEMRDEYGVVHRLWRITEPATLLNVRNYMEDKKLIIADGHHRYETALTYRNERRSREGMEKADLELRGQPAAKLRAPYEHLMMTFINTDDEGLLVLPTHRVIFGLKDFSREKLLASVARAFQATELGNIPAHVAVEKLRLAGEEGTCFIAVMAGGAVLLRPKAEAAAQGLQALSPLQRRLDVVQLHKLLLEGVLGISEEAIRNQTHVEYLRSADEAFARVAGGANAAFLMNPVKLAQIRDIAFAGEVMPQKSTDFYPKLMSGLTIYGLE